VILVKNFYEDATMTDKKESKRIIFLYKDAKPFHRLSPREKLPVPTEPKAIGAEMADGSVFAGLTDDGRQQIYVLPADLDLVMTFNDAAKAVEKLNAQKTLGHSDWQIPSLENLLVLYKNKNKGKLNGAFTKSKSSGSDDPDWYWSSTEHRNDPSCVWGVRFSGGYERWLLKDTIRLSCRPVRLAAAPASPGL